MRLGLALLAAVLAASSCVQFRSTRDAGDEPLTDADRAELRPGATRLADCLDRLGAPNLVWGLENEGTAIAYKWVDDTSWRVLAFYLLVVGYEEEDLDVPVSVLRFDRDEVLIDVQQGRLRDLAAELADRDRDHEP